MFLKKNIIFDIDDLNKQISNIKPLEGFKRTKKVKDRKGLFLIILII